MTYPKDLQPLEDLQDWKVEEGDVDPRGMALIGAGNNKLGTIRTLLASPTTEKAHFAIVKPDGVANQEFAIPLANIRFDRSQKRAYAPFTAAHFTDAPPYSAGARDYDRYNTYWVAILEREPVGEKDRFNDQHHDFNDVVQLRKEELHAHKKEVEAGEVVVRKNVVEETKTVEVPVKREEVVVERHATNGKPAQNAIGAAAGTIGDGEELRIPVREERVSVDKETVVAEEISVDKREVQDTKSVSDTVRREEARIETEGDVGVVNK